MEPSTRLVDWLATLSLCADLANGRGFEQGLRTALLATELARRRAMAPDVVRSTLLIALVRDLGCTAFAPEEASLAGGDDVLFRRTMRPLNAEGPAGFVVAMRAAREAGIGRGSLAWETLRRGGAARIRRALADAACEAGAHLAADLGLDEGAQRALTTVWERWDGSGAPAGRAGDAIPFAIRAVHVAEVFVRGSAAGLEAAREALDARAGRDLDPELVREVSRDASDYHLVCSASSVWDALHAAEAPPTRWVEASELPRLARATADFVDLKSRYRAGHGREVARLARDAGRVAGWPAEDLERLELAALLHDVGMLAVPSGILDKPGPLTRSESERVAAHAYFGRRLLLQVAPLASLADLVGDHHEPPAPSAPSSDARLTRLIAAADVYAALRAHRPHRGARPEAEARAELEREAARGALDPQAVRWVLDGVAGRPSHAPATEGPLGLTARELDCAARLARGLPNKAIAAELGISPRTVQHHVRRAYAKLGVSNRAAATLVLVREGIVA